MRLRIRVLLHALRKPWVPPLKEGRRSADRRTTGFRPAAERKACQRVRRALRSPPGPHWRGTKEAARSPFGAPPRLCAGGFIPRLGSGPRFLELPDPNGRTLSGTSEPAPGSPVTRRTVDAQNRPDKGYKPASGNRTRPIDRLSPVEVPSMGRSAVSNDNGDGCQGGGRKNGDRPPQAVMAGPGVPATLRGGVPRVPAIHVFGSFSP